MNAGQYLKPVRKLGRRHLAAALHRYLDSPVSLAKQNIVDAEPGLHEARRNYIGRPRAAGDPNSEPVADEIFAQSLHLGVRDDPALLDLRIDEIDDAPFGGFATKFPALYANLVTGL